MMLLHGVLVAAIVKVATAAAHDTSPASVLAASNGIALNLAYYYEPNSYGAIYQVVSQGIDSRQWYESGVMWGALTENIAATNNASLAPLVAAAIANASYAPIGVGSFLGQDRSIAATLLGRWNDDIAWYGLASVTAASIYGPSATAPESSLTYLQIAAQTFSEIWEQWDPTTCGGGIFWSRDRTNPKTKDYKSTITNAQAMILASRLAILTKNSSYADKAAQVYEWLKSSGSIDAKSLFVYDGVNINGCVLDGAQYSYNAGFVLGGLAWMFKATDNMTFITEAGPLLNTTLNVYTQNNIITDLCESGKGICTNNGASSIAPAINVAQYKGALIRGLMYLNMISPDTAQQSAIKTAITESYKGMIATCNAAYDCNVIWTPGAAVAPSNYHAQLVAVELATAALQIYGGMPNAGMSTGTSTLSNPTKLAVNLPGKPVSGTKSSAFATTPAAFVSALVSIGCLVATFSIFSGFY